MESDNMSWRHQKRYAKENFPAIWQIMNESEKSCRKIVGGFDAGLIGLELAFTVNQLREKIEGLKKQIEVNKLSNKIEKDTLEERIRVLELGEY